MPWTLGAAHRRGATPKAQPTLRPMRLVAALRRWSLPAILAVVMLACSSAETPKGPDGATGDSDDTAARSDVVRVLGSWEESELETMKRVVAPFEERTGVRVRVHHDARPQGGARGEHGGR